jgi:hypothetical protein
MARLLYIGLWCEADREGRMAWRPATFKLRYFPGDKVNITGLCGELTRKRLVVLYGEGCAFIPTFLTHQHVNPREAASAFPPPPDDASLTRADASNPDEHAQVGREGRERKGKEGEEARDADASGAPPSVNGNSVAYIPLNDGTDFGISAEQFAEFEKLYPAVDVPQTLNEIRGWNLANPAKRKTRSGVLRHVASWLAKEQNRG